MTRPAIVFTRHDDPESGLTSYLCGGARFEPSRTTAANAGALHRIATNRGARRDLTDLAAPGAPNPRKSVRKKLGRVVREIDDVCPELGKALAGIRCETEDGRVLCWLPDRVNGFAITTGDATKKSAFEAPPLCDSAPAS